MADAALFVGWGPPVRGRETKGLEVFGEAIAFWSRKQEAGDIEDFDVVLLQPHGGDLSGFMLVKGTEEQITAARDDEDFARITVRAGQIIENLGVVAGVTGDAIGDQIGLYQQAVADLS